MCHDHDHMVVEPSLIPCLTTCDTAKVLIIACGINIITLAKSVHGITTKYIFFQQLYHPYVCYALYIIGWTFLARTN